MDKSIVTLVEDIFAVGEELHHIYDDCKLYTYLDALVETLLKQGPLIIVKIFINMESIVDDIIGFVGNISNNAETAGQYFGDMLKQFLEPNGFPVPKPLIEETPSVIRKVLLNA